MGELRGRGGFALVTGGSEGIGLALADRLAGRGIPQLLVARTEQKLRAAAERIAGEHGVRVEWIAADLAAPAAPESLASKVRALGVHVEILVNNAAFGIYGGFGAQGAEREAELVRLNLAACVELTAHFLPEMKLAGHGLILNVASTAGFAPVPWMPTYAASKAFLIDWTVALDTELTGTGIHVAVLCPGTTATSFHAVSGAPSGGAGVFGQQTAGRVAEECLRGLDRGRRVIVTGGWNRVHRALATLVPAPIAARIAFRALHPDRKSP